MPHTTPTQAAAVLTGQFRKKPVVIEAVQISKRMDILSPQWLYEAILDNKVVLHGMGKFTRDQPWIAIHTMEGVMRGDAGDWIIRGVKGELYPCKPDIFDATYAAPTPALLGASVGEPGKLPDGWVPLRIAYAPGEDPEDVAFGPQIMMDRLKKWLDRHFANLAATRASSSAQAVGELSDDQDAALTELHRAVAMRKQAMTQSSFPGALKDANEWIEAAAGQVFRAFGIDAQIAQAKGGAA